MRAPLAILAALLLAACGLVPARPGTEVFDDLVACIPPADPGSVQEGSLPTLVDRADVIALVSVTKAEHTYAYSSYKDGQGARLLTLRTQEALKGQPPAEFSVDDGPCPAIAGKDGESFVVLLSTSAGVSKTPLSPLRPTGALRATPSRTMSQLVSDIRAIRPVDGDARALFARYGWTATAVATGADVDLPPVAEFANAGREIRGLVPAVSLLVPLEQYAALSAEVGLDMRAAAGKRVELLSFWLERTPPSYDLGTPFGHVLIADRRLVGAWVNVFPQAGPFSVRDRAAALAADPNATPAFPPPNRFPNGVNLARMYDLAHAKTIVYKTGSGGSGQIVDLARIREIAAALDATLPTTQASAAARDGSPTTYYLHFDFGTSIVSLQYESNGSTLYVLSDGLAVAPGAAFAALIATMPIR